MPIIDHVDYELPLAILSGFGDLEADGGVLQYFYVTMPGTSALFPTGTFLSLIAGTVDVGGASDLSALGRIGDEANVFGIVDVGGSSLIEFNPLTGIRGKANIEGVGTLFPRAVISEAE